MNEDAAAAGLTESWSGFAATTPAVASNASATMAATPKTREGFPAGQCIGLAELCQAESPHCPVSASEAAPPARWLRDRDLQREAEAGLNVVENYNGVNDHIKFGKREELASNRREEQEPVMLCLHILRSALGLINTLMIQDTLALPEWENVMTDADRRGLAPLFHLNMTPYGEIQLRTDRRLDLTGLPAA